MSEEATLDDFTGTSEEVESEDSVRELFGLGEIPADWSIESLVDIAEIIPGNSPPSSTYNEKGEGLPFFQGNSEFGHFHPEADTWCSEPRKEAEKNDVLMSIRAPVGDLNIADRNCCIGRGLAALRPKTLNGLYLFYNLAERRPWLSRLATGSTFKSVTKSDLQLLDIPVPPLSEQRKIATVLHNVDQTIQKTGEIIEQATRVRKGLMQDLFWYGLDDNGELRDSDSGSKPYRETKYGEIPVDWDIIPLKQLVPEDAPIVYGILKPGDHQPNGVPVVKVKDIHDGEIKQDDILHTSKEIHEDFKRAELREGDLLFTIRGTVGRMAFVPESLDGGNITQDTARIRITEANPRFIQYFFETETPNNYFERNTIGQAVQGINLEDLREVPVHLPSEEEQARIVEIIDGYSETLRNERKYQQRLEQFKKGLMQDLLSGKVRTTDTNIEVPEEVAQHG
jgi:type I restriction enzyme S subunit